MRARTARIAKAIPVVGLVAVLLTLTAGVALALERVTVDGNDWVRKHEYIDPGERLRWRNDTNRFHNIKATDIARNWDYFKNLPPDSTRSRVFNNPGTYIYRCTIHSTIVSGPSGPACNGMCGFVHVE